ncbi:G-protein coupled receptor moody-like [Amphiura filiformis]|uniref:G-protein coupled receptor moody-like n=1 Tax=Amphiura filiformis TaxID=82378 RepID=UPI003B21A2D2
MANNTTSFDTVVNYAGFTERVILASLLFAIFLIGAIGNLMVIIAVALSKTLRTRTNVFVVNLSFADFVACLAFPWWSVALLSGDEWLIPGTEWICTTAGLTTFMSIGVSVMSITYIAINRLILITRSLATYQRVYTTRNITIMLVIIYIIAIVLVGMPTFVGFGGTGFVAESHTCSDVIDNFTALIYDLHQGIATGLLLATIVACYIAIYVHVKRHFGQRKRSSIPAASAELSMNSITDIEASSTTDPTVVSLNKKINRDMIEITKNLFVCVCILMVCLIPISVVNLVSTSPRIHVYAWVVAFANSAVNPLIYAWRHPHFKVVLRLMFRCRYADIPQPSSFLQKCLSTGLSTDTYM